jgi:RNA 2',3'-cyclic 3'-phosphodiesterase
MQSLDTERLFVGIPVSERTRLSLERQLPPKLPGRPAPSANWHFTLRFLGATPNDQRDRLIDALREKSFGGAFDIEFDMLGAFPGARRARVLWVGVGNGHSQLEAIAAKVEEAALVAGFDPEPRKFTAHLTLSRIRPPESVTHLLATARPIDAVMRVSEVILYRSEPGGRGSRYTVIEEFPLV